MPIPTGQRWFMKQMGSLGYPNVSEEGQCFGIAAMASQAFLMGEMEQFNTRLDILSQLTPEDIETLKAGRLDVQISKEGKSISGLEAMAFYDGVQLYQNPKKYSHILPGHSLQKDRAAATFVSPVESDEDRPVQVGEAFCGTYNDKELGIYLQTLRHYLPHKTALALGSINHAINLNYDPETNEWTLIDANELPPRTFKQGKNELISDKDGKLLSSEIISAFDAGRATTGFAIFTTRVFSTTSNKVMLEASLNQLAGSEQWIDIHKVTSIEKAERRDAFETSLAIVAAEGGYHEVITALADAKADLDAPNKDGFIPAIIAAERGYHEVITALANAKANLNALTYGGLTPAHIAALYGHHLVIAALPAGVADLNALTNHGLTPAHIAAIYGHHLVIAALAKAGAYLDASNRDGFTPAQIAAQNGNLDVIAALVAGGADPNARNKDGFTLAHIAAQNGHHEVIAALVAGGADPNARTNGGFTPAHVAAQYGKHEVIPALAEAGADLNALTNGGFTPAHIAAQNGDHDVITALAVAGVDVNAQDKDGISPAFIAEQNGHHLVMAVLEKETVLRSCADLLTEIQGKRFGSDDKEMTDYISAIQPRLTRGADLAVLTSLKEELTTINNDTVMNAVYKKYASLRDGARFYTVGMKKKSEAIAAAMCQVPLLKRGDIFNEPLSTETRNVQIALATRRSLNQGGPETVVLTNSGAIDVNKAPRSFKELKAAALELNKPAATNATNGVRLN